MIITLSVAICDDELHDRLRLNSIIDEYCNNKSIPFLIDLYNSGIELLNSMQRYCILFLDIQMENKDGIEIAEQIRKNDKHVKIIYVTNYSNYQTDAFSVRAFGYVIKPFAKSTIFKQLDDVIEYSKQEENQITLTFNTDQGIKTINIKELYFFEADNHKIKIVCSESVYYINDSIMNIFNNTRSYGFSMPHKSFVINLRYISKIKGYDIELINGSIIPISQKRAVVFKSEFHAFLKNNFNLLMR